MKKSFNLCVCSIICLSLILGSTETLASASSRPIFRRAIPRVRPVHHRPRPPAHVAPPKPVKHEPSHNNRVPSKATDNTHHVEPTHQPRMLNNLFWLMMGRNMAASHKNCDKDDKECLAKKGNK